MLGVLWLDDSDSPLARKVAEAAQCYRLRFGAPPLLCYANPADVSEVTVLGGIRVEPRPNILRHHFLVGRLLVDESTSSLAA
jgi:hypothetical protein